VNEPKLSRRMTAAAMIPTAVARAGRRSVELLDRVAVQLDLELWRGGGLSGVDDTPNRLRRQRVALVVEPDGGEADRAVTGDGRRTDAGDAR